MATEQGSRHWWWQRVSALLLVPFTLGFVFAILQHIGDRQSVASAWVAQPAVAVALVAYLVLLFFHAQLGLQVIVEDYVASHRTRHVTLLAIKVVNTLAALAAVVSVLRIALP